MLLKRAELSAGTVGRRTILRSRYLKMRKDGPKRFPEQVSKGFPHDLATMLARKDEQADAILNNWIASPLNLSIGHQVTEISPADIDSTTPLRALVRAIRFSSVRRYSQEFTPPVRFIRDDDTSILLDIAHNTGYLIVDHSAEPHEGLVIGAEWQAVDKTW